MPDAAKRKTMDDLGYEEEWSPFHATPDKQYFGKYRGTVVLNMDPLQQGRLLVRVDDVPAMLVGNWAMPCVPLTDIAMGTFMRPRIGANVWVEFEQGNPEKPVWVGCYWGPGETPPLAKAANAVPPVNAVMTMETLTSGISISDVPIPSAPVPATVILRAGGVVTTISLTPAGVIVNAPVVNLIAQTGLTITAPAVSVSTGAFDITAASFSVNAPKVSMTTANFTVV